MPSASVDRHRFAALLREELDRAEISVGELARRIDPEKPTRGQRTIRRWLARTHSPSDAMLKRVAAALPGVTVAGLRAGARPDKEAA